jgi:hypothetical protein
MTLSDRDRQILAFEESWWTRPEKKAAAIRARIGISPAKYYKELAVLADSDAALDYSPLVVRRLRRRRSERRRERYEGVAEPQHPRR